jgi:N-acetylglutamate synthase-like GNAT family acetyltransferase
MYTLQTGEIYEIEQFIFGETDLDIGEFQKRSSTANMLALTDEKLTEGIYWAVARLGSAVIGISGVTYIWGNYAEKGGSYVLDSYRKQGVGYNLGAFVTAHITEVMGLLPMTLCNDLSTGLNVKLGYSPVPHESLPLAVYGECIGCEKHAGLLGKLCCHDAFVKLG